MLFHWGRDGKGLRTTVVLSLKVIILEIFIKSRDSQETMHILNYCTEKTDKKEQPGDWLQHLSKVTDYFHCALLLCGKLLTLCAARNQIAVAYGMMEKGQLLTDFFIKTA